VQIIKSPFEEITRKADVVYFEFCLHDPRLALTHARRNENRLRFLASWGRIGNRSGAGQRRCRSYRAHGNQ